MLTQHNRKTARLSPDYTFAIRELGVWSGDETIELVKYIFTIPGVKFFLSEDPLEKFLDVRDKWGPHTTIQM